MPQDKTHRRMCFTIFGEQRIATAIPGLEKYDKTKCRYLVVQTEVCPETKRLHLQGFIHFKQGTRRTAFYKMVGLPESDHCYCAEAKGSDEDQDYCEKFNSRLEGPGYWSLTHGQPVPGYGKRTDLIEYRDDIRAGMNDKELNDKHPHQMAKFPRFLETVRNENPRKRKYTDPPPTVKCYWGKAGAGKSYACCEEDPNLYKKRPGKWWPGYKNGQNVLFDEFNPNDYSIYDTLTLLDGIDLTGEVKNGERNLYYDKIWLTSNQPPENWYLNAPPEQQAALLRRFTEIRHFTVVHPLCRGGPIYTEQKEDGSFAVRGVRGRSPCSAAEPPGSQN